MSDYIRKSALIEALEKSMKENNHKSMIGYAEHIQEHRYLIHLVEKQPTLDEKEIIRKAFERVIKKMEEKEAKNRERAKAELDEMCLEMFHLYKSEADGIKEAIEIIKEECGINE